MQDARFDKLAALLVDYSTALKSNEKVLIESFDAPDEMTIALIRAARKAKAVPFVQLQRARVSRELALEIDERQLDLTAAHELARMKKMDAYIAIRGSNNISELADVPIDQDETGRKKTAAVAGPAGAENEMGRAALANSGDGAARRDEHGGV